MSINIATPNITVTPENPVCLQFFGNDTEVSTIIVNGLTLTVTIEDDSVTTFDGLRIEYLSDVSPYRWVDMGTATWDSTSIIWDEGSNVPITVSFNEGVLGGDSPIVSKTLTSINGGELQVLKIDFIPMSDQYTSGICMSVE